MNDKEMEKFTREILNVTGLRTKLRERIPQIDRLESLDLLKDLFLTGISTESGLFVVRYEGIATQGLYPHVKANLIKSGITNRKNVLHVYPSDKFQEDEYEEVRFGISGNSIQVILRVYNPNYKR